ncbi:MAG: hypothetical protein JXB88_03430 [Spirochaetales bacterium]|nr:hypothetical protein [Spirochaetales bacterium]
MLIFILLFISFSSNKIYCDDLYNVESLNFIPPRYYVGDEVELKIKISVPLDREVTLPEKKQIETDWIEITNIQILPFKIIDTRKVHDVSIFFISFKTGTITLPYLRMGDIELTNLEIHTLSVLDKNKEINLAPSRGQLHLPDTWIKLSLLLLLVILVPVFLFIISRYALKWFIKTGKHIQIIPSHTILLKGLKKLKKQMKTLDSRSFYIVLSDLLKNYLQIRLLIPALTSTTREISALSYHNVLDRELSNEILKILSLSDFVKFGGRSSSEAEMNEVISKITFIVKCIEEEKKSVEP